jgi:hypothetical protein
MNTRIIARKTEMKPVCNFHGRTVFTFTANNLRADSTALWHNWQWNACRRGKTVFD